MRFLILLATLMAAGTASAEPRQALDEAWWTGPISAAGAATLPAGHYLIEPYLYDVMTRGHYDNSGKPVSAPHEDRLASSTFFIYGLSDDFALGMFSQFAFRVPAKGQSSSGVGLGDFSFQAQYRLTQFQEGHWWPTSSILLIETVPTGRYDRLSRPSDGLGGGVYSTALALYLQDYFWMDNGRILRARLNFNYGLPSSANVKDASVYGTPVGFSGNAKPGNSFTLNASAEYSITSHWVLASDVIYERDGRTRVLGSTFAQTYAASESLALIPAVEYNFNANIGVIFGTRFFPWGRNTTSSVTPVGALNMVF